MDDVPRKSNIRARRRQHAQRVKQRARSRAAQGRIPGPSPEYENLRWRDIHGVWRKGIRTWRDVHAFRAAEKKHAEHPATCSCWMCGNPRRHEGAVTPQESRRLAVDYDVLAEHGIQPGLID